MMTREAIKILGIDDDVIYDEDTGETVADIETASTEVINKILEGYHGYQN